MSTTYPSDFPKLGPWVRAVREALAMLGQKPANTEEIGPYWKGRVPAFEAAQCIEASRMLAHVLSTPGDQETIRQEVFLLLPWAAIQPTV